jgi:hypothetical protein
MDQRPITTSTNNGITQHILVLGNCQILHNHGHNTLEQSIEHV